MRSLYAGNTLDPPFEQFLLKVSLSLSLSLSLSPVRNIIHLLPQIQSRARSPPILMPKPLLPFPTPHVQYISVCGIFTKAF